MTILSKGANAPVDAALPRVVVRWRRDAAFGEVDVSAFLLGPAGKVSGDADMVFYGQPASADGSVRAEALGDTSGDHAQSVFAVNAGSVPTTVDRVAFTGTLHDAAARKVSFGNVRDLEISVVDGARDVARFPVATEGATETALILGELYRRQGAWKFRAVGQGFEGGLRPLAEGFGVDVSDAPPPPPPRPTVDLRKRTVDLAKRDPKVGAHAGNALDVLEARGLAGEKFDVWIVIDISASMDGLYNKRKVDDLLARVLAAAFNLDEDGEIGVVLFGKKAHYFGTVSLSNYREFGSERARHYPLEGDTMYGEAIDLVRSRIAARAKDAARPAYVMFVTDGGTRDVRRSKDSITEAAREPIFWQFMAIGSYEGGNVAPSRILKRLPRGFDFLEMLDTMEGRVVDNANFFAVEDPSLPTDAELYGMMFAELPEWLGKARALGIAGVPDDRADDGGNAPVPTGRLGVEVLYRPSDRIPEIDVSAFLLRADGRVSGDADMVFYGQPAAHAGAVALKPRKGLDGRGIVRFHVSTADLPASVERIPFAATIHEAEAKGLSFSGVGELEITVLSGVEPLVRFPVVVSGKETSLILGELYRRQGSWKFRAVAQGYEGGLKPLAESYGMDISAPEAAPGPAAAGPAASSRTAPVAPAPEAPRVSLSKISLTKASPSVSLAKRGDAYGEVAINLNWNRGSGGGGLFSKRKAGVDLDVGCLFEMADGQKGGVQALGDSFGDFDGPPYIHLSGDDRTGAVGDGEWIRVNGRRFEAIKRILVYAFIYDGAPNWGATDGVVTVTVPGSAPVEVRLADGNDNSTMCAVALVENVGGQMRISREVRYFRGHKDMDQAYRWGLRWVAGSKD